VWKISGSIYTLYRISGDYGWRLIYLKYSACSSQPSDQNIGFGIFGAEHVVPA
jgi:hypothetical protein